MLGKTIRLYLAEGEPNGVKIAEIINWTGKVVVAPRSKLPELAKRKETKRAGVYFLVGRDPENSLKERVYIGESDNVFDRLKSHQTDTTKEFWTQTALVTSTDLNLTKSHIRYLESRLIELVGSAKRAVLANGNAPAVRTLPEPDVADMEFFLDQIRVLLPVLGFDFAQPTPIPEKSPSGKNKDFEEVEQQFESNGEDASPLFYMSPVGTYAIAQEIEDEFVVSKGSTARRKGLNSWTSYKLLREQLVQEGKLLQDKQPNLLIFAEDISFESPSAAAAVVFGGNQNGRKTWKTDDGKTYADWQEEKLEQAISKPFVGS